MIRPAMRDGELISALEERLKRLKETTFGSVGR